MIILTILFYLFIILGLINMVHFAMYLVGANIYDARAYIYKSRRGRAKSDYKPLVSVLVPAYNEELVIERGLQSVWNNTYENIEIIVVSDGSTDNTAAEVLKFINSRTRSYRETTAKIIRTKNGLQRVWQRGTSPMNRRIKFVQQKNGGKASALNNALKNHVRGELVMTLDADSLLHKKAIANAVKYFEDPEVAGVAANVRIIEEPSVLGILQRFEHMVSYRSKKLFTVANCELIVGGVASTYRRSIMQSVGYYDTDTVTEDIGLSIKVAALGNKEHRLIYAADVAAMTEGVGDFNTLLRQRYRWKLGNMQNVYKYREMAMSHDPRYTKMLTWYRMPMAFIGEFLLLLEPLTLAYIVFLSVKYATVGLLIGAYISITVYVLLTIWPDEYLSVWGKLKASAQAPFLYFIFYIMNIVQLTSVIRCLINKDKILTLSNTHKSWVSPARAGKAVTFS
jgi:poly-beta-1,6-N-acetyl-D-glucosamine synthase